MPAFQPIQFSYKKLSYVKIARVDDFASGLDNFSNTDD